jgi:hypothetical protein
MSEETFKVLKATITRMTPQGALDPSKVVVCQFNPKEFQITEQFKWVKSTTIGSDTPDVTFAGGEAQGMTINLLFDSTDTGRDVRENYATLLVIAAVDKRLQNQQSRKGEPARCKFQWGKLVSFDAVIEQISQKFTLFKPDGTPLRAEVAVTFSQVRKETKAQNPTSYSEPRKTWVVREGERLDWIAYQEYGDPACWRHIAESNGLLNPQDLRPGQVLQLVPLP